MQTPKKPESSCEDKVWVTVEEDDRARSLAWEDEEEAMAFAASLSCSKRCLRPFLDVVVFPGAKGHSTVTVRTVTRLWAEAHGGRIVPCFQQTKGE